MFRVVIVYLAGVVFGSVGGSLPSPTSYLAGRDDYKIEFRPIKGQESNIDYLKRYPTTLGNTSHKVRD